MRNRFDTAFKDIDTLLRSKDERQLYDAIATDRDRVRPLFNNVFPPVDAAQSTAAARFLRDAVQAPQDRWFDDMRALIKEDSLTAQAVAEMNGAYCNATVLLLAVLAGAILAGLALASWITRSITIPLNHAVRIAETVAAGNLNSRINKMIDRVPRDNRKEVGVE